MRFHFYGKTAPSASFNKQGAKHIKNVETRQQIPVEKADGAHWGVLDVLADSPPADVGKPQHCWHVEVVNSPGELSLPYCPVRKAVAHFGCSYIKHAQLCYMCRSVEWWTLPACRNGKAFWDSWVQSMNALSSHLTGGFEKPHFAASEDVCPCDFPCRDYCRITPSWWSCLAFRYQI